MVTSGVLRSDEVVFYHPLDNYTEFTQDQSWIGSAGFTSGILPDTSPLGLSAVKSSELFFGSNVSLATYLGNMSQPPVVAKIDASSSIVFYRDAIINLETRVVSVSGTTVSLGSGTFIGNGHYSSPYSIATMPSGKFVVINRYGQNGVSTSWVLSTSGDVVSVGSPTVHAPHIVGATNDNGGSIAPLDDTRVLTVWGYYKLDSSSSSVQARVGTVSGTSISYGPEQTIETVGVGFVTKLVVTTLSATKAVIAWLRDEGSGVELATMVLTVSGDTITGTSGTVYVIDSGNQGLLGICTLDSDRFAVVHDAVPLSASGTKVIIGQISETVITYGSGVQLNTTPGGTISFPTCYTLDTDTIFTLARVATWGEIGIEIFTISGTTLTSQSHNTYSDDTFGGGVAVPVAGTAISNSTIVFGTFDATDKAYVNVGQFGQEANITASSGGAYPSVSGATRVVSAFWAVNPTSETTTVGIGRGYQISISSGSITFGSGTAVWDVALGVDDGSEHLIVLDFENTTGTTWQLNTSVDGVAFVDRGTQASGIQAVATVDTPPSLILLDASVGTQWIDELVFWAGDKESFDKFTYSELTKLFNLAPDGRTMNQFQMPISGSNDLFMQGINTIQTSGDFYIQGYDGFQVSGDLFIGGLDNVKVSGDLFVRGYDIFDGSGNLFINGYELNSGSHDLFIQGHNILPKEELLFIKGHEFAASTDEIIPYSSFGDEEEFLSADGSVYNYLGRLNESKFIVAYQDNSDSNHGTVKIGIVSGTTVTFGAETEYLSVDNYYNYVSVAVLDESTFIVVYQDELDSGHGTAKVGTVSGTTVTFGPGVEFLSTNRAAWIASAALDDSSFVVGYSDWSDSKKGKAKVGTVSGTDITFGSESIFHSLGESISTSIARLDNFKFVVGYRESVAGDYHGAARIGTITGTDITFGDEAEFVSLSNAQPSYISIDAFDSSKFVLVYADAVDSNHGTAKIGIVDGTSITFGAEAEFLSADGNLGNVVKILDESHFIVTYKDGTDSNHGTVRIGTVSNTDVIFNDEDEFLSADGVGHLSLIVLDTNKFVVAYTDTSDSNHGTVKIGLIGWSPIGDNLFIAGHDFVPISCNLYTNGYELFTTSGNLYIQAIDALTISGDLFVEGHINQLTSGDLFVSGYDIINESTSLFVYAPPPDIYGSKFLYINGIIVSESINLYITGAISGIDDLRIINHLVQTSDYYPQLIDIFNTSVSGVNIEIWDVVDGQNTKLSIANSGCYAIGNTGRWGWSTEYLSFTGDHKKYHYYYRMTSNISTEQYGEFLITVPEHGRWSYPD